MAKEIISFTLMSCCCYYFTVSLHLIEIINLNKWRQMWYSKENAMRELTQLIRLFSFNLPTLLYYALEMRWLREFSEKCAYFRHKSK